MPDKRDHSALRQTWQAGQFWETKVDGCDIWVPVGAAGYAEPVWDPYQDYRQATPPSAAPLLTRDEVRAIYMAHGFTIKEGHNDLKPYVYEAAETLMRETARRLRGW